MNNRMDRNTRKRKTLTYPTAPSSWRRRCEEDHADEWRDWASLPRDVLFIVLSRLPQTDILRGAGVVCSHWQQLAKHDPLLWRDINLTDRRMWWRPHEPPPAGWKAMVHAAVDRSDGQCLSFTGHVDADILVHLANSSPLLKILYVASWPDIDDKELITDIIKKLHLLERLVIWSGLFKSELFVALLDHCPHLELLNVAYCRPTFRDCQEPIATMIQRSTTKRLLMPALCLL